MMVSSREVAKYGPNAADFMRSFGRSMTAQIPHNKWTSTALRAEKRMLRQSDEFARAGAEAHQKVTEANKRENAKVDAIFNKIVKRVQKQHPELSRIKARAYARKKDPVGRKYDRLRNQGFSASEISKRLSKGNKRGSSGRSSG